MRDGINIHCNVSITLRERGKLITRREGHNVWTTTGREYDCLLKAYNPLNGLPYRSDRIDYIGLGNGAQMETVAVTKLVSPVTVDGNRFLVQLDRNRIIFPLPVKTAVRFTRVYLEEELSLNGDTVDITEAGLFTDGDPAQGFLQGSRADVVDIIHADFQSPVAYHSFDPIPKTANTELEVAWELRH